MIEIPNMIEVSILAGAAASGIVDIVGLDYEGPVRDSAGDIYYIKDGMYHREDGPAVTWYYLEGGIVYRWYIADVCYSMKAWMNHLNLSEAERTYYTLLYGGDEHESLAFVDVE